MEDTDMDSESPIPPHSTLLSTPGSKQFSQDKNRLELSSTCPSVVPDSADWSLVRKTREFSRQYAHTYFVRLLSMRPCLKEKVEKHWGGIPLKPIAELCETSSITGNPPSPKKSGHTNGKYTNLDESQSQSQSQGDHEQHIALREDITVAIIGTIFKQQPEKPSILQELVDEIELRSESDLPNAKKTNFVSSKDVLVMEDETTRVRLIPSTHIKNEFSIDGLVNGIVCAVKGKPNIDGKFEVVDMIWATPKHCLWPKLSNCNKSKMIFVSGLHLGQQDENSTQLGMLFEFLEGLCGSELEQGQIGEISRVFFVGNLFANTIADTNTTTSIGNTSKSEKFIKIAEIAKKLDILLSQLARTMEIYIISGKTDPVESMYPQPPIHSCLFPNSSQYSDFHLLSNPTRLQLNVSNNKNTELLLDTILMDGEPIADAMRYSNISCPLEMSKKILQWGHLCPTAPDTLPLHPGVDTDIFVLKSLPNLFIVGNQQEFSMTDWHQTKIITLPIFSQTNTIGIFTTNTAKCSPMEFNLML